MHLGASDIRSSGIPDIGHGDFQVSSWQNHLVFLIHPQFLLFSPLVLQFTISISLVLSRVHTFHHIHDSHIYLVYRNVFLIFLMFYLSSGLWPSWTLYIALPILAVLSPVWISTKSTYTHSLRPPLICAHSGHSSTKHCDSLQSGHLWHSLDLQSYNTLKSQSTAIQKGCSPVGWSQRSYVFLCVYLEV